MIPLVYTVTLLIGFHMIPIGSCAINTSDISGDFWFVTDFHVDQNYSRTGNPSNLCHEDTTPFSDVGLYGNFLCDSPLILANATIEAMKYIQPNPDFIIWTGDNLPHTQKSDPDWDVTFSAIKNITVQFLSAFPDVPIFPSIGNHDTFPPNMLLPGGISDTVYEGYLVKGGWNKVLSKEAWSTFRQGGFYSQVITPGLRLISLNTILWYAPNNYTLKIEDPANQFKWLEDTLQKSLLLKEKVYIIGHVPPGFYNRGKPGKKSDSTYHEHCLKKYLDILHQYSNIIIGQMYGHIHMDMFQLFQFDTGEFKSSSLLASSVTPWHFKDKYNISLPVYPSIRLMNYSQTDFSLLDYHQYYMNLTKVNSMKISPEEQKNLFEDLYTFTSFYEVPDLSTKSLVAVYEKMKKNETVFQDFFKFLTAGKETAPCKKDCKIAQLCAMSCTSIDEYDLCMHTIKVLNFSKTDLPLSINMNVVTTLLIALMIVCLLAVYVIYYKYWRTKFCKSSNRVEYEPFTNF